MSDVEAAEAEQAEACVPSKCGRALTCRWDGTGSGCGGLMRGTHAHPPVLD